MSNASRRAAFQSDDFARGDRKFPQYATTKLSPTTTRRLLDGSVSWRAGSQAQPRGSVRQCLPGRSISRWGGFLTVLGGHRTCRHSSDLAGRHVNRRVRRVVPLRTTRSSAVMRAPCTTPTATPAPPSAWLLVESRIRWGCHDDGFGLFDRAADSPYAVPQPARGRKRSRPGRRLCRDDGSRAHDVGVCAWHAVPARALPPVRPGGGRVCPQRGMLVSRGSPTGRRAC